MIIALINGQRFFEAETIEEIGLATIKEGYHDDMEEFINNLEDIDFYNLPDKLEVTCEIRKPIFTIK